MPAQEVVHTLAVTTPRLLFPSRNLGTLEPGAEATFVVLRGGPLALSDQEVCRPLQRAVVGIGVGVGILWSTVTTGGVPAAGANVEGVR